MKGKVAGLLFLAVLFCMIQGSYGDGNTDIEKILGSGMDKWSISGVKYSTNIENGNLVLSTDSTGYVTLSGKEFYDVPAEYTFMFYLKPAKPYASSISVSVGCAELPDKSKQAFSASVSATSEAEVINYSCNVQPQTAKPINGKIYFQAVSDISLNWPEELRKNIEYQIASAPKIQEKLHTLRLTVGKDKFSVYVDGRFVARIPVGKDIQKKGTVNVMMYYGTKLLSMQAKKIEDIDERFFPVELTGFVNNSIITKGASLAKGQIDILKQSLKKQKIPFVLPVSDEKGNDHLDIGPSWTRFGAIKGYIAANFGTFGGRWISADRIDPVRFCMYVPYARYKALHIIGTFDGETNNVPVITAQFYRPNAGHPMNFSGTVPIYSAKPKNIQSYPVKLKNGQTINLFHIIIPIDPGKMDWFSDLSRVGLELTKEVKPYRAYPDPLEYSWHSAGLPSGVHVYAATLESVETDIDLQPEAVGHVWTSPAKPGYSIILANRTNSPRTVNLTITTSDYDGIDKSVQKQTVNLPAKKDVNIKVPLNPKRYGLHYLSVICTSGNETYSCSRNFAYLHPDTRERGNWSEGKGPIFGYWNWSGAHDTPDFKTELIVMAQAGAETNLSTYRKASPEIRELAEKLGYVSYKAFDGAVIYVNSFAYANAKYYDPTKPEETQKWLIEELKKYMVEKSPINKPEYILFFPEPGIGPITYGIWPTHYGEPDYKFSEEEEKSFQMQLEKFLLGARAVRKQWPDVKILLPHGDPHYTAIFLRRSSEARELIDGIGLDLPGFERTPEQQINQVVLNRLYPVLQDVKKYKPNPYLVVVEGTCISSADYDTSYEDQANIATRNFLVLIGYGINNHESSNAPFDCANYWGENHYGGGYCTRLPLAMPKLAYVSYATLTRHINRCNFTRYVPTGSTSTYCQEYRHYKTGKLVYVLWTIRGKRPVSVNVSQGQTLQVYDINDNPIILKEKNGSVNFVIGQSPVYLEGLENEISFVLGEPDHSDSQPSKFSKKIANLSNNWKIFNGRDSEYENTNRLQIERFPGKMSIYPLKVDKKYGARALALKLEKQDIDRKVMPYYTILLPEKPVFIPGKSSYIGIWVHASSDWGRIVYSLRDAKGEKWISVGTKDDWNSDDIRTMSSFCFDGWRYLRFQMPSNSPYDCYRERGTSWWGSYGGDGIVDLPLTLEKIIVERRSSVIYGNQLVPAKDDDVLFGDLYAEYENSFDMTEKAVSISRLRMPVPQQIPELKNPILKLDETGVLPPVKLLKVEDPEQMPDGTRCHVFFEEYENVKGYDIWASAYPDGRGAIKIASGITKSGSLIQGLKPDSDFYLFVVYTDKDGKQSHPSKPLKIRLKNKFLYQ